MIPSNKWFPSSLQERAAWFENFNSRFVDVYVSLGFVVADQTALNNDNVVVQFVASTQLWLESLADAIRQYRIVITEGDIGDPTPAFPDVQNIAPGATVPTGIFERLDRMVKRIRTAPNYTPEIGALLGIIPSKPDPIGPADLKPVIKASESFSGYKFTLNVTRMGMEAYKVQIQRTNNGNGNWTDNGFATSNPYEVTVTPTTPGEPERVYVRAILMQKNEPIGQPSDIISVTVNP